MTDITSRARPARLASVSSYGRPRAAAAVRIAFGALWAANATFKWLPGFIHGQTLEKELGGGREIHTPVIHQWLEMWHGIGTASPGAFAVGTAVIETLIAIGLLFGAFSNTVLIGSALFSFGIWSTAEHFNLPWTKPGITDLGASIGYVIAALALYCAAAGSTWSLDRKLRGRLGKYAWLTSPAPKSEFS
jgi:nitrite reductase (NO-forming)